MDTLTLGFSAVLFVVGLAFAVLGFRQKDEIGQELAYGFATVFCGPAAVLVWGELYYAVWP